MTIAAVVVLAATAALGAAIWFVIDHRRDDISTTAAVLAAAAPSALLGIAALLALGDAAAGDGLRRTAAVIAVVAAIPGGSLLATAVLRVADRSPRSDHESGVPPAPPPPPPPSGVASTAGGAPLAEAPPARLQTVSNPETLRGGATIGALERVAIVVSLLAGWPEGLALTLAVKGFGRYPEMRKPAAPERFIIGTFASILWAAAVTGVAVALRS